jgi:hypothetical protein
MISHWLPLDKMKHSFCPLTLHSILPYTLPSFQITWKTCYDRHRLLGPVPRVSTQRIRGGLWELASVMSSKVIWMLLGWGPHFEVPCFPITFHEPQALSWWTCKWFISLTLHQDNQLLNTGWCSSQTSIYRSTQDLIKLQVLIQQLGWKEPKICIADQLVVMPVWVFWMEVGVKVVLWVDSKDLISNLSTKTTNTTFILCSNFYKTEAS